MIRLSPKQQEIRDREQRILQLSRKLILAGGYQGLSLEALAAELQVSRGTIYNHFPCREEILLELLAASLEQRRDLFQRAAAFRGAPRVRLTAVITAAEVFARQHPEHFRLEQIVNCDTVAQTSTSARRGRVRSCRLQCSGMVTGIVRDALAQDHLTLADSTTPEDLVLGLLAMTDGAYSQLAGGEAAAELGVRQPWQAVRRSVQTLLDGYGWTPTSKEFDYGASSERIVEELFLAEFRPLKQPW